MTYEMAQIIIDDASQNNAIAQSLRNLNKLAKILKKRRMDNGYEKRIKYLNNSITIVVLFILF